MDVTRREFLLRGSTLGALALVPADLWSAPARPITIPQGYVQVGIEQGVPPAVLFGVALQESQRLFGHRALPWPWTLNVKGKPYRFQTCKEASASLCRFVDQGVSVIDIGLMQVCWHFFGDRLLTPAHGLQPYWNLRVGASILRDHHKDTHDWFAAIGRYHAPGDPARAHRYAQSVVRRIAGLRRA